MTKTLAEVSADFMAWDTVETLMEKALTSASFGNGGDHTHVTTTVNGVRIDLYLSDLGNYSLTANGLPVRSGTQGNEFGNDLAFEENIRNAVRAVLIAFYTKENN